MGISVVLRNVYRRYRGGGRVVDALTKFNLDVAAGEFVALLGPPESGKTTILNIIAGLDGPDGGEVIVGDRHLEKSLRGRLSGWRARHIGMVFRADNLLPTLSAAANVELPLFLKRLSRDERKYRLNAAFASVGLASCENLRPEELSAGQRQRAALARAMIGEPGLLLCDEPSGDLDRSAADGILRLLQSVNRDKGMTVILATSDPAAAAFAARIVRLQGAHAAAL